MTPARRFVPAIAAFSALALGAVGVAGLAGLFPAHAQQLQRVDLELVLAVDVSQSMDYEEHLIQRQGYIEAFRHDDVIDSIVYGSRNGMVVTYFEWGDAYDQTVVIPWTLIQTREDAHRFADMLENRPINPKRRTSISGALHFAAELILTNNYEGMRQVIDISGDGPNNSGGLVEAARDAMAAQGIIVNGLPIMIGDGLDWWDIPNLDQYYEDCVITGPGSFIAPVRNISEMAATIRAKMVLEIAGLPATTRPAQFFFEGRPEERANCLIGEQMLGRGGRFR